MNMPTLIHIGDEPSRDRMHRITNMGHIFDHDKPRGGFWCSTIHPMYGCDWIRAAKELNILNRHASHHTAWAVMPRYDAKVLHIEDNEDYEILTQLYPLPTGRMCGYMDGTTEEIMYVDWEAVAKEYDVIWVHKEAVEWMRDWDCETVLFTNWESVGYVDKHAWVASKHERMAA
jgi:hypothetical protein